MDIETGFLTIITLPTILYLKYQSYVSDRMTFLSIKLADLWQDISKEVSFVQIVIFTFDQNKEEFTFQGSKQSSDQFQSITNDLHLNCLLESMVLDSVIKAPGYQIKDFSRNIGQPLKPILAKLFNDKVWSFHAKQEKVYIAIATYQGQQYKINLRGVNSEDKVYVLTLGLNDPDALCQQNENVLIQQQLLEVSLFNTRKRFIQMQNLINEANDKSKSNTIIQRTMESMDYQSIIIRNQVKKQQDSNKENNLKSKENEGNKLSPMLSQPGMTMSKQNFSQNQDQEKLKSNNEQQNANITDVNKNNEQGNSMEDNMSSAQLNKQKIQYCYQDIPEDEMAETYLFSLKQEVEDVESLYDNEVQVEYNLSEDITMNTNKKQFRQMIIQLFENAYWLKKKDDITSSIKFSSYSDETEFDCFIIQVQVNGISNQSSSSKVDQQQSYFGQSKQKSISQVFRYLNGDNVSAINTLEQQHLQQYLSTVSNKQIQIEIANSNIISTIFIFAHPKHAFTRLNIQQLQLQQELLLIKSKPSKVDLDGDGQIQNYPLIGLSIDYENNKHESLIQTFSTTKPHEINFKPNKITKGGSIINSSQKISDQDPLTKGSPASKGEELGGGISIFDNIKQKQNASQLKKLSQFRINGDNLKQFNISQQNSEEGEQDEDESSCDVEIGNIGEYAGSNFSDPQIKHVKNYEDKIKSINKKLK